MRPLIFNQTPRLSSPEQDTVPQPPQGPQMVLVTGFLGVQTLGGTLAGLPPIREPPPAWAAWGRCFLGAWLGGRERPCDGKSRAVLSQVREFLPFRKSSGG